MLRKIVSFGYRHEWPPEQGPGIVIVDIRKMFKNPYHDKRLRKFRGTDKAVQEDIQKTPEFNNKVNFVKEQITVPGIEIAYIGCTGGHHRSVYLAQLIAQELGVEVEHRDYEKP